jgi:hypothetical protein
VSLLFFRVRRKVAPPAAGSTQLYTDTPENKYLKTGSAGLFAASFVKMDGQIPDLRYCGPFRDTFKVCTVPELKEEMAVPF